MIDAGVKDNQKLSPMVPMIIIIHCCEDDEDVPMDTRETHQIHYNKQLLSPPVTRATYEENPWIFTNNISPFLPEKRNEHL